MQARGILRLGVLPDPRVGSPSAASLVHPYALMEKGSLRFRTKTLTLLQEQLETRRVALGLQEGMQTQN